MGVSLEAVCTGYCTLSDREMIVSMMRALYSHIYDNHVYAIDAGVEGSSEDSRVLLGTMGHHHEWAGTGLSDGDDIDDSDSDGLPGFGFIATAASLLGGAYYAASKREDS